MEGGRQGVILHIRVNTSYVQQPQVILMARGMDDFLVSGDCITMSVFVFNARGAFPVTLYYRWAVEGLTDLDFV